MRRVEVVYGNRGADERGERIMALRKKTERQLEEVYRRNLNHKGAFSKSESPELHEMCKNCELYCGDKHDYTECRDNQCFKNWLALEYLDWINGY